MGTAGIPEPNVGPASRSRRRFRAFATRRLTRRPVTGGAIAPTPPAPLHLTASETLALASPGEGERNYSAAGLQRVLAVTWESWRTVSPPRARLGWIFMGSVQCSHRTVPSSSTSVRLDRPQFLHCQLRRVVGIRPPLSHRRPVTGASRWRAVEGESEAIRVSRAKKAKERLAALLCGQTGRISSSGACNRSSCRPWSQRRDRTCRANGSCRTPGPVSASPCRRRE